MTGISDRKIIILCRLEKKYAKYYKLKILAYVRGGSLGGVIGYDFLMWKSLISPSFTLKTPLLPL